MRNAILVLLLLITGFAKAQTVVAAEYNVDESKVYNFVEVTSQPEYPGGMDAFRKYIMNNMRMPEVEYDVVARVLIDFVIGRDGCITDIKVRKSPGYGLEEEIRRLLTHAKAWKPTVFKGKTVMTRYMLPLSINLLGYNTEDEKKE